MKKVQPVQNTFFPERKRKPPQLKWSMTILMLLCWLLPLAILTMAILTYVSNRFSGQMRENIEKSMDTAVEICEMRVEAAVRVSRSRKAGDSTRATEIVWDCMKRSLPSWNRCTVMTAAF